jgi:uncharacterized protein (DUF433 family)
MNLPIQPVNVPLVADEDGGLRVGGTRVLLERIIHAFQDGATPEGIAQSYDTLKLGDVYAVLTWYLQHKSDADAYLEQRARGGEAIRQKIEGQGSQTDRTALRARLIARQGAGDAPSR